MLEAAQGGAGTGHRRLCVGVCVIALLLGHESVRTTDIHQHANMAMKKRAPRDDGTRAARCSQTLEAPDPLRAFRVSAIMPTTRLLRGPPSAGYKPTDFHRTV